MNCRIPHRIIPLSTISLTRTTSQCILDLWLQGRGELIPVRSRAVPIETVMVQHSTLSHPPMDTPDGQGQDQEQQWNGQPQAFVEPIDTTADAPYYTDTPSPMNSHQPSYFDHNQAQQQQWGDGINEYGTSIPSPTAPAQHQPIRVTESRLARQRSSNRNNKQSVDMMLRRMRSESTEEIESRSAAANQW